MKNTLLFSFFILIGIGGLFAQPVPGGVAPVISEIMYNPPEGGNDTLEFLEITNPSLSAFIPMGGYYFSSGIDFTFYPGFVLGPGERVLIAGDSVIFETWYGLEAFEWQGQAAALSNSGEGLALRDANGAVADTVFFDDAVAWPQQADGGGYSLVLCDLTADNNLPASWTASENATGIVVNGLEIFADPGAASTCTPTGIADDNVITTRMFPNPSNGAFRLEMKPVDETSNILIYNAMGQMVYTTNVAAGTSVLELNVTLPSGQYSLMLESATSAQRLKLMIQ